jgi:hypothetical protein
VTKHNNLFCSVLRLHFGVNNLFSSKYLIAKLNPFSYGFTNVFVKYNKKWYIIGKSIQILYDVRSRHTSGGQSPASHRGGPGSIPGLVMWDFVMDKRGAGTGFLRELRFPLPIYIPSGSPQSSSLSPEAGTIGQEWPQCQ